MPLFSIATPTHDTTHLSELHQSLLAQTCGDWEWLVLPNNGAALQPEIAADPRVRVLSWSGHTRSVGLLKKLTCAHATGDYIVEADHDDLLLPTCLEELAGAFADPAVGFVYSDTAMFGGDFIPWQAGHGWTWRSFKWRKQNLFQIESFPPSAAAMSRILYAPDHVRSWRRSVYEQIGGHNTDLALCDDHELLIRTYLATKMVHIPRCLYLYRIENGRTSVTRNGEIQQRTVDIGNAYLPQLAARWADLSGLRKVDLGGGFNKPDGYTSIDMEGGDISWDLSKAPWPLEDNSVGVVRASHILEHLPDKQQTMAEIWRVLADGGWLLAEVPSATGAGAHADPTHRSYWVRQSFWYYTRADQAQYIRNDTIRFQEFVLEDVYPNEFYRENNMPCTVAYLAAVKSDARRPAPLWT